MYGYIVRRLIYATLTLFGVTVAAFVLIHSVPGDPVSFYAGISGSHTSPAVLQAIRERHHLDQPIAVQFGYWIRDVITLDFGRSIVDRRPVTERIFEKLPRTLTLNVLAFLIAAAIGVPIGLWSARRPGRLLDRASATVFFFLYSLPSFWVALLMMQFFSVHLNWFPLFGMSGVKPGEVGWGAWLADNLRYLALPVLTLTYTQLAIFARFSRAAVSDVIRQDFITTARAKGMGEGVVLWRHAARNALLPLITLLGLTIPYLISGSVIVEEIFQWDGIGLLFFESIRTRDYPTAMGLTVLGAVVTLLATLLADLLYAVADPRVRLEGRR